MQEFFSNSYVEELDSKPDFIKECKLKGHLTKNLLDLLPEAFAVLEIVIKEY